MEQKAQGAIEYLLIIGAAILVVAIVIIAITSVMQAGQGDNNDAKLAQEKQSNTLKCQSDVNAMGGTGCSATAKTSCNCCKIAQNVDTTKVICN